MSYCEILQVKYMKLTITDNKKNLWKQVNDVAHESVDVANIFWRILQVFYSLELKTSITHFKVSRLLHFKIAISGLKMINAGVRIFFFFFWDSLFCEIPCKALWYLSSVKSTVKKFDGSLDGPASSSMPLHFTAGIIREQMHYMNKHDSCLCSCSEATAVYRFNWIYANAGETPRVE